MSASEPIFDLLFTRIRNTDTSKVLKTLIFFDKCKSGSCTKNLLANFGATKSRLRLRADIKKISLDFGVQSLIRRMSKYNDIEFWGRSAHR